MCEYMTVNSPLVVGDQAQVSAEIAAFLAAVAEAGEALAVLEKGTGLALAAANAGMVDYTTLRQQGGAAEQQSVASGAIQSAFAQDGLTRCGKVFLKAPAGDALVLAHEGRGVFRFLHVAADVVAWHEGNAAKAARRAAPPAPKPAPQPVKKAPLSALTTDELVEKYGRYDLNY